MKTIYPKQQAEHVPKQGIKDVNRKEFFTNLNEDLLKKVRQVKHESR